jgi:Lipid-droplet associated hydrolase
MACCRDCMCSPSYLYCKRHANWSRYMGRDEMVEITTDKWDSEVWGAVHPSPTRVPRPKMFFYFGEKDHWVADHTRDDLMRARGRGEEGDDWKPWMEIDKLEIPHGFVLGKSMLWL